MSVQKNIFLNGPLVVADDGVEVVEPHLPAAVGRPEECGVGHAIDLVGYVTPLALVLVLPE